MSNTKEAPPTGAPEIDELMKFYGVESVEALVSAQARHIEKLQAKLPPLRDEHPRTPREG